MDYDKMLNDIEDRYRRLGDIFGIHRSREAEALILAYKAMQEAKEAWDDLEPEFQ